MSVFHLSVVTPDRLLFDGDVEHVIVRTLNGDICVLKGHARYISGLGTGRLRIRTETGERTAALSGGFIKVDGNETQILATTCEWQEDIDLERAKRAEQRAKELLKSAQSQSEQDVAELKLKRALNRISIVK